MNEDKKERHIQQARDMLREYSDHRDEIQSKELRDHLDALFDALRTLKDNEYIFESGEKELDDLYDRYLPYVMKIIDDYDRISSVQSFSEVKNVREKLFKTIDLITSAIKEITDILPNDEISDAKAEKWASEMKKKLDEASYHNK